jgi:type II restriction enzyme
MSDSELLRYTHTKYGGGNFINSDLAKSTERKTKEIIKSEVLTIVQNMFPDYAFEIKARLYKKDIVKALKDKGIISKGFLSSSDPYIMPDGGLMYATKEGVTKLVLVTEVKTQGTNDKRVSEGLVKQAQGNAIERAAKNDAELKNYMYGESYFPYVLLCQGCDFLEGSSITDRITALNMYSDINTLYIENTSMPRTSIFARELFWTAEEITNICVETVIRSIKCIQKNN